MQGATCYITVTAFPSTSGCDDCLALHKNLGEEFCELMKIDKACIIRHEYFVAFFFSHFRV